MVKTLIVDDCASFRRSFADHLRHRYPNIDIAEAADSEEALAKVITVQPQLIFVDIQLPGQNGLELTRRIKAERSGVTVAILTAYDLPEYREAAQRFGADYFFSKSSSSMEELLGCIQATASGLK